MKQIKELLSDSRVLVSDGAWGTYLQKNGLIPGDCPELWNIEHEDVVRSIAESYVAANACCIETFAAIDEATLAVKAAKANTNLEVICTFTFERTVQNEYRTMMGVSPTDMAKAMLEAGADIIGTNCGNGSERMIEILRKLRAAAPDTPILVHANAGMPTNVDGKGIFHESPEEMASHVTGLIEAGAGVIGGCCGTTSDHIKAIRNVIDSL